MIVLVVVIPFISVAIGFIVGVVMYKIARR